MKKILIVILATWASTLSGQTTELSFEFSIVFGSCFQNDPVRLKINNTEYIILNPITSDSINSMTRLSVHQDNSAVWVTDNDKKTKYPVLPITRHLQLDIMLDGTWKQFTVDLKKGKIILVNNCLTRKDGVTGRVLTITQHQRTIQVY